ncbi:hypothetical protein [Bacillus toyonensis]|uniref:hypothetical protein n=1 Tax=Bacillus toyonensis TaxID=155322 RepID=UPI000BED8B76|nr:hypothetical protein [Bacillus toyonensis]PDZ26986.1 hypothetical protein CON85_19710 [Bacillus toyonensis]PFX48459.1 hypothetical protein COL34_28810 [Bacillus toyonensis]PHF35827.1 hypothetical protein COF85_21055 [Bacillus toyonensis]
MEPLTQCLCCFKPITPIIPRNDSTIHQCCEACKDKQLKLLSDIRKESLGNIQKNQEINTMLDAVAHSERELIDDISKQPKSKLFSGSIELRKYMFSMIEEIHRFTYEASFECIMYCDLFESVDRRFFSDRFFQRNAVYKVIGAWEKVIRFHAIYFGIELNENKKKNTLLHLSKKLGKTDYKETTTFKELYSLKSKGLFKQIDDTRKSYDHKLSYEAGKSISDITNIVLALSHHCISLYKCIEDCIGLFQKSMRIVSEKFVNDFQFKLPVANKKLYKKKSVQVQKKVNIKDVTLFQEKSIHSLFKYEARLKEALSWNIKYSAPPIELLYFRLFDVTVRLHESARSLAQMLDMYTISIDRYNEPDKYWLYFEGLNYRYFLLSSLLRVYSAYDKLAIVIQEFFEAEPKRKTFEGTIEYVRLNEGFLTSLPPMKICNRILSHSAFKKVYKSRQDHFHLLTTQNFLSSEYKEVMDFEVFHAIIENSKLIYELIDSVDQALINFHLLAVDNNK